MDLTVTLFDLDGVLIRPGGYRAAVKATVNYFSRKMGLGDLEPAEEELAFFEANGVTSEWDMVPICLAFLIERARSKLQNKLPDVPLLSIIQLIHQQGMLITMDYREDFERLIPFLDSSIPAAEALLVAVQRGKLFPEGQNTIYLQELLGNTRQPSESITMRVFQNYILGDKGFQSAYSIPAVFESLSYLETYDVRLLSDPCRARLAALIEHAIIQPAVITARPSLRPADAEDGLNVYSPEAEMALGQTGLGNIPMVGLGSIQYLAGQLGVPADNFVKPSPVQALAGLGAALGFGIQESLLWAAACGSDPFQKEVKLKIPFRLNLHIFEDSTIGIVACQRAVLLLEKAGYAVSLHSWGIASNPDKIRALKAVGAIVFPDVNQAVGAALGHFPACEVFSPS